MQLPGGAGARQHETIGRTAHTGKRERADDGAICVAAPARCVNLIAPLIVDLGDGA